MRWRSRSKDCALAYEGAPGGIELHPDLDGLFPRVPETEEIDPPEELFTDFDLLRIEGVEDNPDASEAIQGYVKKGYLSCHDTLEECRSFLGGSIQCFLKLGCIVKVKGKWDWAGHQEDTYILDGQTISCYEGNRKKI